MKDLQHQFQALKDLSTTPEMMERLKRRMTDPVTDMWQFININKRLEASEQGIDKVYCLSIPEAYHERYQRQ